MRPIVGNIPLGETTPDAELLYYQGALFADCGEREPALRVLQSAIEQNCCAYSNPRLDPLLRKVRPAPGFSKLLTSAKEYQDAIPAEQ